MQHLPHAHWCPGDAVCLCGTDPRQATAPKREPAQPKRPKGAPPHGPAHPVNRSEARMVERGERAGYAAGRHQTPIHCPYEHGSRPAWLWVAGARRGLKNGARERQAVLESYVAGLEVIEAGAPSPWR